MHIYLIGMPGAGKSTLGRALAAHLNRKFIDLDKVIEENSGQTIPGIFEEKGERYFRELEAEALKTVSFSGEKLMIATGGGTPCFYENMAFMNTHGLTIYLKTSPEILADRLIQTDLAERPLLKNKSKSLIINYLQETLHKRATFYGQAGIIFESRWSTASVARDTDALVDFIRRYEQTA
ncbi:shikimate kinase [Adhaeribacter terreus]|uniref:Shikimate kinase n=1 Tax=Adhaeribacter terreus TaxID=529703 RepID=A0ABW0EEB5_9BACT